MYKRQAHKAVAVEDIDLRAADVIGDGAPARRKHGRVRELHLRVVANGPVLTEDADLPVGGHNQAPIERCEHRALLHGVAVELGAARLVLLRLPVDHGCLLYTSPAAPAAA